MKRILTPIEENGTTRFYFDNRIKPQTFLELFKEFSNKKTKNSFSNINDKPSAKIVDINNAIEINMDYISFYPEIKDKQEVEKIRERIYKHVAKKAAVYKMTALENEELSITSLIKGDLRGCASLLYYCLHKFISSMMYSFLNKSLNIADHNINIEELEHFTSGSYYKYFKSGLKFEKVTEDNYSKEIGKRVKPFKLIRQVVSINTLEEITEVTVPYLELLCKKLFEVALSDQSLVNILEGKIKEFNKKITGKIQRSQEEEVEAAIATALHYYIVNKDQNKNAGYLLLDIITLRLYWLRQTADYAYDFEVKTSTREMSLLLSTVQKLIQILESEETQLSKDILKDEIPEQKNILSNTDNENNVLEPTFLYQENNIFGDISFYNVSTQFPEEIMLDVENIHSYLLGIHLDNNFSKEKIVHILNLSEQVRNEGKYFVFEDTDSLYVSKFLCFHITDEGKWTVWYKKNKYNNHIQFNTTLTKHFKKLLELIYEFADEFIDQFSLISSQPVNINSDNDYSINSILDTNKLNKENTKILQNKVIDSLGNLVAENTENETLSVKSIIGNSEIMIGINRIEVRLVFGMDDINSAFPWYSMTLDNYLNENEECGYLTIIVDHITDDNYENVQSIKENHEGVTDYFMEKIGTDEIISNTLAIIPANELYDCIYDDLEFNQTIISNLVRLLNDMAFKRIHRGTLIDEDYHLLKLCTKLDPSYSFPYATIGSWYFRNTAIELEASLQLGQEFYKKSILTEKENNNEYTNQMLQKQYLEMAKFYMNRTSDYNLAKEHIENGLKLGKDNWFYEELIELETKLLEQLITPLQIAGADSKD